MEESPPEAEASSSLFFSARESMTEDLCASSSPPSSPNIKEPEPAESPFLSSQTLQQRIEQERDRVNSKRDRLRSNRSLLDEPQSNLLITPVDHDDGQLAFLSVTSGTGLLEENDDGWIDATNITSVSGRDAVSPTKVIPLSTRQRHVNDSVDGTCSSRFKWIWIWIGVIVVIVSAAGVVIGAIVGLGSNDNNTSNGSSGLIDVTGCEAETNILPGCVCREELPSALPQEIEFNRDLILTFLIENGVANTTNTTSTTSCSIQNQALLWISDLNNHAISPPSNLQLLQRYALAAIYQKLHGDMWTTSTAPDQKQDDDATPWLDPSSSECAWEGVVCSEASQRIVELHLEDHNLDGLLPTTELGLLVSLRDVVMRQNSKLVGALTKEFTTLSVLQTLDLSDTSVAGTLPTEWSDRITELHLSSMKLTGSVPTELGLLTRLRSLNVASNGLAGTIPLELSTNLVDLEELDLSSNQLGGSLAQDWNSPALETFRVNANANLSGSFPAPYSTLLSFIDFRDTSLEGVVPSGYCDLMFLDSMLVDCDSDGSPLDIQLCECCQCTNNEDS
jgi:hypothetical protein